MKKENKSSVKQKDIADIMNRIEEALFETDYVAVGYDNTGTFLHVIIDKKMPFEKVPKRTERNKKHDDKNNNART